MVCLVHLATRKDVQVGKVAAAGTLDHEDFDAVLPLPRQDDGGGKPNIATLQRFH